MSLTILIGNITNDLEVKPAGQSNVLKFGIAVKDEYKKDVTHFFQLEAWGGTGENIAKYFSKGSKIYIEGNLKQNRFEDKDGNKREKVFVNVRSFKFLESKGSNQGQGAPKQQASDPFSNSAPNVNEDTLPF